MSSSKETQIIQIEVDDADVGRDRGEVDSYQEKAHSFAKYGENKFYPICGLSEECGEVMGKVSKFIRKHEGRSPFELPMEEGKVKEKREYYKMLFGEILGEKKFEDMIADSERFRGDLKKELGDVCWMVAEICTVFGLRMESVMRENIKKLEERAREGLIVGEGDTLEERKLNAQKDQARSSKVEQDQARSNI